MNEQHDQGKKIPEGYEHVKERLDEAKARLSQIDKQIENMPPDRGPTPRLVPKGAPIFIPPSRDDKIKSLEALKEQIREDTWTKTEADIRNADNVTRTTVRDNIREELFPNPFKGKSKEELDKVKGEIKDEKGNIENSQNYMAALRLEFRSRLVDGPQRAPRDREPDRERD